MATDLAIADMCHGPNFLTTAADGANYDYSALLPVPFNSRQPVTGAFFLLVSGIYFLVSLRYRRVLSIRLRILLL